MTDKTLPIEYPEPVLDAIQNLGDAVVDVMDQMLKGSWVDDQGHPITLNISMINLATTLGAMMKIRAEYMNYTPVTVPELKHDAG